MIPAARKRLVVLYAVVFALLASLGGRLWYLQVMTGVSYASAVSQDEARTVIVPPVRGQITDDTGQPLVDNNTALVVSVNRSLVTAEADGGKAELQRLAHLLGMSDTLLQEKIRMCTATVSQPCWPGSPYQPIPVDQHVPTAMALQIMENQREYPGVSAQAQPVTHYVEPYATDASQILGYLQPITSQEMAQRHLPVTGFSGEDLVGQSGLEQQYDPYLRGTPGLQTLTVNAAGTVTGVRHQTPAKPGDTLVTSLNEQLQQDVYTDLASAIQRAHSEGNFGATTGAAVVMTTKGRVLAMASYPTYNPSVWTGGISERQFRDLFGTRHGEPILERATQGEYYPGSTWKVTTTAAAVADGYSLYGTYNCPASITINGQRFINDGAPNLGPMSLHEALIQSCDTVFYEIAEGMWQRDDPKADDVTSPHAPVQKMQRMEMKWGFGRPTGIDLPGENVGDVPTREWLYYFWKDNAHRGLDWCKYGREYGTEVQQIEWHDCYYANDWSEGQAVIAAIGQGLVSVTPIQLARAYAALANGGTLYKPTIGEALLSPSGKVVKRIRPHAVRHLPVAKSTLAYIRNALQGVVTQGTAASAFHGFPLGKVCVAGKTGTAEVLGKVATSVFASYAPCNHPKYVTVVMIPNSGYGADVSAPAVRKIWDALYGLEGVHGVFPTGQYPSKLPGVSADGAITRPAGYQGAP
jgi:penicillin-binding protein 2